MRTLTLLGPDDSPPDSGAVLVVLDSQSYPKAELAKSGCVIEAGDSVEALELDGQSHYRLRDDALNSLEALEETQAHVLFFATDDTHVNTFLRVAEHCPNHTFVVHESIDLHAAEALKGRAKSYVVHRENMPVFAQADIALMGNDNGWEERLFIHHCRQRGIPTVSLQEATNVEFAGPPYRMQRVDMTCIQGLHALRQHCREVMFLTGNPRFDHLQAQPAPTQPRILINCNFTYGIAEDWARPWVDRAIDAAQQAQMPYAITRHPRDETDLTGVEHVLPSNAFKVHDQIRESSIIISRDSSVPYEALLMNRHVIYFNPFHEEEYCLNNDDTGLVHHCTTTEELIATIRTLGDTPFPHDGDPALVTGLRTLFTGVDGKNARRVMRAIETLYRNPVRYTPHDALSEGYLHTKLQVYLQNKLRPRLRAISWLRGIWRCGKWLVGGYRK